MSINDIKLASLTDPGAMEVFLKKLQFLDEGEVEYLVRLFRAYLEGDDELLIEPRPLDIQKYRQETFRDHFIVRYQENHPHDPDEKLTTYFHQLEIAYAKACNDSNMLREYCKVHCIESYAKQNPPAALDIDKKAHFIKAKKAQLSSFIQPLDKLYKIMLRSSARAGHELTDSSPAQIHQDILNCMLKPSRGR